MRQRVGSIKREREMKREDRRRERLETIGRLLICRSTSSSTSSLVLGACDTNTSSRKVDNSSLTKEVVASVKAKF